MQLNDVNECSIGECVSDCRHLHCIIALSAKITIIHFTSFHSKPIGGDFDMIAFTSVVVVDGLSYLRESNVPKHDTKPQNHVSALGCIWVYFYERYLVVCHLWADERMIRWLLRFTS